ncbi:MAG: ATP-binding protein [Chlamydiota bacterium]
MRYEAKLSHLSRILDDSDKELERLQISQAEKEKFRLALEEAIVNIMHYAYPEKDQKPLEIVFKKEKELLIVEIRDWGVAFDPSASSKKVDESLSLEERPIGGLGIIFIKKMVDKMQYRRDKDCNELILIKKI